MKERDWQGKPKIHINSLSPILYKVRTASLSKERCFTDGYTSNKTYAVGFFRCTRRIPSGNHTTHKCLWQRKICTFVGHSCVKIVRSQWKTFRKNELGSEEFIPARRFCWVQLYGYIVPSVVHCLGSDLSRPLYPCSKKCLKVSPYGRKEKRLGTGVLLSCKMSGIQKRMMVFILKVSSCIVKLRSFDLM